MFLNFKQVITIAFVSAFLLPMVAHATSYNETALDRYLKKDDGYYSWEYIQTIAGEEGGLVAHELNVTSQKWLTEAEVSMPIWKHQVFIYVPALAQKELTKSMIDGAIVYLGGGGNHKSYGLDDRLVMASNLTQKLLIEVKQIPNQKMTIVGDGDYQYEEDWLVARTLDKYLTTGNEEWPLYLPMVKSAVKGMDAALDYLDQLGYSNVEKVSVIGESKRGWTAWLTGAVDDRVVAILPAVIDVLDIDESLEQQWESIGEYYLYLTPYTQLDLPCRFKTPEGQKLLEIVDPISYQDRLVGKAKYLLNGSGDYYFSNTNASHYWDKVSEPKHMRYVPNSGHGATEEAVATYFIWAADELARSPFEKDEPKIVWDADYDKSVLTVTSSKLPIDVKFWTAQNDIRDFRIEVVGDDAWSSTDLSMKDIKFVWDDIDNNGLPDLNYQFQMPFTAPDNGGYQGHYFTLNFGVYTYSTSIYVAPNKFKYDKQHCVK